MGADLCLMVVPLDNDLEETLENIRNLDQQSLEWAKDVWQGNGSDITDDEMRQELVRCAEIAYDTQRRDIVHWESPSPCAVLYAITGGMTWGDDPTEAFTPLQLLLETGVTEK